MQRFGLEWSKGSVMNSLSHVERNQMNHILETFQEESC
jgi:hypothetical protein